MPKINVFYLLSVFFHLPSVICHLFADTCVPRRSHADSVTKAGHLKPLASINILTEKSSKEPKQRGILHARAVKTN
jgi:hypothetical protein